MVNDVGLQVFSLALCPAASGTGGGAGFGGEDKMQKHASDVFEIFTIFFL